MSAPPSALDRVQLLRAFEHVDAAREEFERMRTVLERVVTLKDEYPEVTLGNLYARTSVLVARLQTACDQLAGVLGAVSRP